MKTKNRNRFFTAAISLMIGMCTLSTNAAGSGGINESDLEKLLEIYQEAADIIGDNTFDEVAVLQAEVKLRKFFLPDARVTVSGIDVVNPDTGRASVIFSEFVGRLFAHNVYYHTRHNGDTGTGVTIEKLAKGRFRVVSFVTADHYQDGGRMLKIAARYEDIILKTDKNGNPKVGGQHLRVKHRSVIGEAQVSINGGTFDMPMNIIIPE